ncbi:hypothetical protein BGW38_004631 [Lunasporangiospora selenospora]|uniref:XPG-I domain-containing protein n=1 Tax=Lunasporangiospora selenospora TaxID=979761 RepID=A0A9P6KBE5_9FUNG|nr:hypothetical protein BGW38_004631 [Lunasporangiospora selenospora]
MGVSRAFEIIGDCNAITVVEPRREGPCEIDGSAVSYVKFKTTEGRLLLKEFKKMAKRDVTCRTLGPVPPLAQQISRFKSFLSKILFPCWIRTRCVDPRATSAVVKELQKTYGWKAHKCAGQFDVCAGRMARENPNLLVVSTDSDLLFVGAERLIRLQRKGTRFYSYPVKSIIQHCGLETQEEWVAAAVVSLNDYDPSVGRISFRTAIKDIMEIRKDWIRKKSKGRSARRYVKELCKRKNVHQEAVNNSMDSFVELIETPSECTSHGNEEIDESIRRIINRVEVLTHRSKQPIAFPTGTETKNDDKIAVRNSHGYTSRHKYYPKAFRSAFTSQAKNTQPVCVSDQTIGRPRPTDIVLSDEDIDDNDDTFPKFAEIYNDAVPAQAEDETEENSMKENVSVDDFHTSDGKSEDNLDGDSRKGDDHEEEQQTGPQPSPKKLAVSTCNKTRVENELPVY